jgi:hypothetical protein
VAEMLNMFTGSFRGGRNECFMYGIDKTTRWFDYDLASCYATVMSMCGDPNYEQEEVESESPCYTDLLTKLKNPDYNKTRFISPNDSLKQYDFKNSYSSVRVLFKLPETIKYPGIPVQLDKNITVYPSEGESLITGLEYQSAINILNQELYRISTTEFIKLDTLKDKYYIKIIYGAYIPFKKGEDLSKSPFYNVINDLQANRRK